MKKTLILKKKSPSKKKTGKTMVLSKKPAYKKTKGSRYA